MLWSSQRKFSEKCSKVNGNQCILGVKRCILVDFDAKFQENRVSTVKSTEIFENGLLHQAISSGGVELDFKFTKKKTESFFDPQKFSETPGNVLDRKYTTFSLS